jgi:hypothetical protein
MMSSKATLDARHCLKLFMILSFAGLAPALSPGSGRAAEFVTLSATDFVLRCDPHPCTQPVDPDESSVQAGVLFPTGPSHYFASVAFPINGRKVCSFTLFYQNGNATETMKARLFRKALTAGTNALAAPTLMAAVSGTIGVSSLIRKTTDTTISSPTISNNGAAYYVELEVANLNINPIAVQIGWGSTCP